MANQARKPIPYGLASYKRIREENCYYLDKTNYIPLLEETGKFLFFIRPRRFGKSSLLTVLESYYDINRQEQFEFLFKGTYIYDQPTSEKNSYLILKLNFSQIDPHLDKVEASFEEYLEETVLLFGQKYRQFLGDDYFEMMRLKKTVYGKVRFLLNYVGRIDHKIYILIDEYDNFANTILTTAGQVAYQKLTHGAGFFRFFFNVLKGAADSMDSGVGRMFITGVSPVTMDDVTSGFNIGQQISLHPQFNQLLGFAETDVMTMLEYYGLETTDLLPVMRSWYDNYRFAAETEQTMFNTDMVLYFVKNYLRQNALPEEMIDQNVRIDYGKLRHLIVLDRRLNGNFSQLLSILSGQSRSPVRVVQSFPVERLTKPDNFISLLFYFGLLSYTETGELQIPNETVRQLMYSYIREGYQDVFNVDLWRLAELVYRMAYHGEWQAVFQFLASAVQQQTAIRDYLYGEKVIQTFLLAYLSVTDYYIIHTEAEFGKGFVDLYMEPFFGKHADVAYSYLIELKYLSRAETTDQALTEALAEAKTQLQQYATDSRIVKRSLGSQLIKVALIFSGWELCEFTNV
ncbi:AAA family ATPase [Anaerolineales bacterium HSG6]|nr:AAA family ATPase [Anaerolineales bacterium HSG6]